MAVYAEWGPPPFVTMAAFAGFKPKAKPGAGEGLYSPEDFANLLQSFPGGFMTAPPSEMGDASG